MAPYTLPFLVSVPRGLSVGAVPRKLMLSFDREFSQVLTNSLHMFDFRFGGILMPKDDWFLISVPLVIFLAVMIAAALTLPQP